MFTIHLEHLNFTAYHGVHDEEKRCAGEFEVNLELKLKDRGEKIVELNQTADYTAVFSIVQNVMNKPTSLLETVIQNIESELLEIYPGMDSLFIKIEKKNPPIANIQGSVAVSYQKKYQDLNV
jgi:dihydroneopterin aldolase